MNLQDSLLERVRSIFREELDDNSLEITEDTIQADIPRWDSMFQIHLLLAIENEFNVRISAKDASQMFSVRGIVGLLEAKKARA